MAKAAKQDVRKKGKGYKMPDPLPEGEILEDILKMKWKLGISIGKGGFGEIYSAQSVSDSSKGKSSYPYVIKIEPHNNGPLFVEMHFYMRNAKQTDINAFMSSKKIDSLGMPAYVGSGSHEHKGEKYRFIVMEKFGSDIWKLFVNNKKSFPASTVYKLGLQILDVLEYVHSKGYVHADIKAANILLSLSNPNQVYLVDFGLAEHYSTAKEFKPNPKKAHNGTIEYLSRDAHLGVQTRRGDLEILAFNLIQWLGCTLPWEKDIKDPVDVKNSKEMHMNDMPTFLKTCFKSKTPPDAIKEFLKYITTLKFDSEPNYKKLRKILLSGLESAGESAETPLHFNTKTPVKRKGNSKISASPGQKKRIRKKLLQQNDTADESAEEEGDEKQNGDREESEEEGIAEVDIPKLKGRRRIKKGTSNKHEPTINNGKKNKEQVVNGDNNTEMNGYTAEMQRIKNKIEAVKLSKLKKPKANKKGLNKVEDVNSLPSTSSDNVGRNRRNRKEINYNESTPRKSSEDTKSDTESPKPLKVHKGRND